MITTEQGYRPAEVLLNDALLESLDPAITEDLLVALFDIALDRNPKQRPQKTARRALARAWQDALPSEPMPDILRSTPPPDRRSK